MQIKNFLPIQLELLRTLIRFVCVNIAESAKFTRVFPRLVVQNGRQIHTLLQHALDGLLLLGKFFLQRSRPTVVNSLSHSFSKLYRQVFTRQGI